MSAYLPQPTIVRLCTLYQFLCELEKEGIVRVSSIEIENKIGVPAHTIRKDINYFGEIGNTRSGYEVNTLKAHIAGHLGIGLQQKACIVGLGNLGQAVLQSSPQNVEFMIVAGFDSNINKIETLKSPVPLFPSYEISDVVKRMGIDLGIIAVPAESAREVADRLIDGGIKGMVNFAAVAIKPKNPGVIVRNMDINQEFRIISVLARYRLQTIESKTI